MSKKLYKDLENTMYAMNKMSIYQILKAFLGHLSGSVS